MLLRGLENCSSLHKAKAGILKYLNDALKRTTTLSAIIITLHFVTSGRCPLLGGVDEEAVKGGEPGLRVIGEQQQQQVN